MNRHMYFAVAAVLATLFTLPVYSDAKMTSGERSNHRADRSADRQAYHQERVAERQQMRYEIRENRQEFGNAETPQDLQQIHRDVREQKRDYQVERLEDGQDFLHDRIQDRQQLRIDVVE